MLASQFFWKKVRKYSVMAKILDIFGNDTSQIFDMDVR